MNQSSLTIKEIKPTIDSMCPISIVVNGNVVWDDFGDTYQDYDYFFEHSKICDNTVTGLFFQIVHFHHCIAYIMTN